MARVDWQDLYAILPHMNAAGAEYEGQTFTGGKVGLESGKYVMLLNNHPSPELLVNRQDHGVTSGLAIRSTLFSGKECRFTLEFDATEKMLGLFCWLLFQNGVVEAGSPTYTKTCQEYTSSACEVWADVLRRKSMSSADSIVAHGCICRSLTISGNVGGALKCSAEFVSRNSTNTFNASGATLVASSSPPLLFQNVAISTTLPYTYPLNATGFSYTVSNNAIGVSVANDAELIKRWALGPITHSMSLTMPVDTQVDEQTWQDYLEMGTQVTFIIECLSGSGTTLMSLIWGPGPLVECTVGSDGGEAVVTVVGRNGFPTMYVYDSIWRGIP